MSYNPVIFGFSSQQSFIERSQTIDCRESHPWPSLCISRIVSTSQVFLFCLPLSLRYRPLGLHKGSLSLHSCRGFVCLHGVRTLRSFLRRFLVDFLQGNDNHTVPYCGVLGQIWRGEKKRKTVQFETRRKEKSTFNFFLTIMNEQSLKISYLNSFLLYIFLYI